jgi:hypothetical protein
MSSFNLKKRRITACLNACEGISTEHLEACLSLGERIVEFRRTGVDATHSLLSQRDDLLAALKACRSEIWRLLDAKGITPETARLWPEIVISDAAIAKAEAGRGEG